MHEFMTFLVCTSMKQMHFSGVVIDLEGNTDGNKDTKDLFYVLFLTFFVFLDLDTSLCNIFLLMSFTELLICLDYKHLRYIV